MIRFHDDTFEALRLWLRDGVDVYVSPDAVVHFVFLATRRRLRLRVTPRLIESLEWFDGTASVAELGARFASAASELDAEQPLPIFHDFTKYLYGKGILVRKDWMRDAFDTDHVARYSRQLSFFLDIEESEAAAGTLLKRIMQCKVALIGVGAVGSWILRELTQVGFQRYVLVDPKTFTPADRTRNALFDHRRIGEPKVAVAEEFIKSQTVESEIVTKQIPLDIDTSIEDLIGPDVDLIINTADEPYIGATSIKLSRYCVEKRLPLLIAGGFDAHLASLSEMIVPGQTPCADCYAIYFAEALRGWKPISHPVVDRRRGFGGLATLSAFAASTALLKIVRLFSVKGGDIDQGRGEFLFDQYGIDSFKVERDPRCSTCGAATTLQTDAD